MSFTILLLCIQACLIQNVFGGFAGPYSYGAEITSPFRYGGGIGYGAGAPFGTYGYDIATPCGAFGTGAGFGAFSEIPCGAGVGSYAGFGALSEIPYGAGVGSYAGFGALSEIPCGTGVGSYAGFGAYGGAGVGNCAVIGQLPVGGSTVVAGQLPIIGAVEYAGVVPAAGAVTIAGNCACGPYMY